MSDEYSTVEPACGQVSDDPWASYLADAAHGPPDDEHCYPEPTAMLVASEGNNQEPVTAPILGAGPSRVPILGAPPAQVLILGAPSVSVPILGAEPLQKRANDEMGSAPDGAADERASVAEVSGLSVGTHDVPITVLRGDRPINRMTAPASGLGDALAHLQKTMQAPVPGSTESTMLLMARWAGGRPAEFGGIVVFVPEGNTTVPLPGAPVCALVGVEPGRGTWAILPFTKAQPFHVARRVKKAMQRHYGTDVEVSFSAPLAAMAGLQACSGHVLSPVQWLATLGSRSSAGSDWRVSEDQRRCGRDPLDLAARVGTAWKAGVAADKIKLSSDRSLARIVVEALGGLKNVAGVGEEVRRQREDGAWERVSKDTCNFAVMLLDGRKSPMSGGGEQSLTLNKHRIGEIAGMIPMVARKESFFPERATGVVFRDVYFGVDEDGGLVEKKLESSDRVLAEHVLPWPLLRDPERFLDESEFRDILQAAWADSGDDEALWQFLMEWLGLALLGLVSPYGKHVMLVGTCTYARRDVTHALEECFPREARCHLAPHEIGERFKPDRLRGKRFNLSSDMSARDLKNPWRLKAALMGNPFDVEAKSVDGYSLYNRAACLFSGDEGFTIEDAELRSMLWTILFEMEGGAAEPGRADRLAQEVRLLTSLAICAAKDVLARGSYVRPASMVQDMTEWMADSDPVLRWIRENLVEDPQGLMSSEEIAKEINDAANNQIVPPVTLVKVASRMKKAKLRKAARVNNKRVWMAARKQQ